jgi:cell division ATPase FtsA
LRRRLLLGNLPINAHVRTLAVVVMHKLSKNVAQLGGLVDKVTFFSLALYIAVL